MDELTATPALRTLAFQSGFNNNAYLVICRRTNRALIIDAPSEPYELIDYIKRAKLDLTLILITHEHWDHIDGLPTLLDEFDVGVRGAARIGADIAKYKPRFAGLADGAAIELGKLRLKALATPGHTPGSFCYFMASGAPQPLLFSGDTLFPGGPGKTASKTDFKTLLNSLERRIFDLPSDAVVAPGHGAPTTLKACLSEYDIFKRRATGEEFGEVRWTP